MIQGNFLPDRNVALLCCYRVCGYVLGMVYVRDLVSMRSFASLRMTTLSSIFG
jgi:hypothetical protein